MKHIFLFSAALLLTALHTDLSAQIRIGGRNINAAKAIQAGSRLTGATVLSSMGPCTTRKSKPASCSELIILHHMKRVVFAAYEPPTFVTCLGEAVLRQAGIEVTILSNLAQKALDVNRHLAK